MLATLSFFDYDADKALELLEWIALLGRQQEHEILLCADAAVGWVKGIAVLEAAQKAFGKASIITNAVSVTGWPEGPNSLFFEGARHIATHHKCAFLNLETDSIPIRSGWLDAIEKEYEACGKPFMGHVYTNQQPEFPRRLMSGIAVFPSNTSERLFEVQAVSYDMHHAEAIVPSAAHTNLIHHFWGQKDLAPTFVEFKGPNDPIKAMVLENIPKDAVLFHRCKDGSLMNILKKKMFPQLIPAGHKLLVVIPFCGRDVEAALKNINWIAELGGTNAYPCLLSYDDYTQKTHVNAIRKVAEKCFSEVKIHAYRARTDLSWPHGPNIAFQEAARFVQANYKIPFLWLEADAVPLKPQWLDVICSEYYRHGKSFYAPIVPKLNHQNGVGVYAWNTASRCPRMMTATNRAWDYEGMPDTINDRADAEPIISHCWGEVNGKPHATEGEAMRFLTVDQVRQFVHPSAVLYHRVKDGSLIAKIREMRKQ